jgi:hypothetical protein
MPAERFRWLPDLLPLDGAYAPDFSGRPPTVSYIKHAAELRRRDFGPRVGHLNCSDLPHAEVLRLRRRRASVVIDNVSDGHYGLAGQEAAIMGLPVVVFNHEVTLAGMDGWRGHELAFPFFQARTLDEAVSVAGWLAVNCAPGSRRQMRRWAEAFLHPQRLVQDYWEPFIEELAA